MTQWFHIVMTWPRAQYVDVCTIFITSVGIKHEQELQETNLCQNQPYQTHVTRKQTLRSLSLSYQKQDGCAWLRSSFFWYDNNKDLKVYFLVTRFISALVMQQMDNQCLLFEWKRLAAIFTDHRLILSMQEQRERKKSIQAYSRTVQSNELLCIFCLINMFLFCIKCFRKQTLSERNCIE